MQDADTLATEFSKIVWRARNGIGWVPPTPGGCEIVLTSFDSSGAMSLTPLIALMKSVEQSTGLSLTLEGGGYGCFDLVLSAAGINGGSHLTGDVADVLKNDIVGNAVTQRALNELPIHAVRVRTPAASETFRAYNHLQVCVATTPGGCGVPRSTAERVLGSLQSG